MSRFSITKPFYKLCPTLLLCLLTGQASAAFYFNKSFEVIEVDSHDIEDDFSRSITLQFMSVCELKGCRPQKKEQDYRFGLSSGYIAPQPSGSGSRNRPSLTHTDWLDDELERAYYIEGRAHIPREDREWSRLFEANRDSAIWHTATINFTFDDDALEDTPPGQCKNFYLIGLDDESRKFWDTLEICLRKTDNRKIKISNLRDAYLTEQNNSSDRGKILPFCVYVSDGSSYALQATGQHVGIFNQFNLSNGQANIPYNIEFSANEAANNWQRLGPGDAVVGQGNDNKDQRCGGVNNARFNIYLDNPPDSASGVYTDTVTVTVIPK